MKQRQSLERLIHEEFKPDYIDSYWLQEKKLIKRLFLDALHTARSNQGFLDEHQHGIFHMIGINSGAAQHEIMQYFQEEAETFKQLGLLPNWDLVETFLERMAFKYKGCVESLLIKKGIILGYDQLETEGISNEKKDGYGINELKRRRGRPPKSGSVGATLLRSEREPVERTRSKRKKLSSGSRPKNGSGRNELHETPGSRRSERGRNEVQESSHSISTDTSRRADLRSGSGQTPTDSDLRREARTVLEVV